MPHDAAPDRRLRRWRRTAALRELAADVRVHPSDLIQPLFVGEMDRPEPVASMPGVKQWPAGAAVEEIARCGSAGCGRFSSSASRRMRRRTPRGATRWTPTRR